MIRAMFFDLDGTLLDSRKRILPGAVEALEDAQARGIRLFVATARSPRLEEKLGWPQRQRRLFSGGIYSNGGVVRMGDRTDYALIPSSAVRAAVEEAARFPEVHLSLHMPGNGHAFNFPVQESMMDGWVIRPEDVHPLDEAAMARTLKVMMFHNDLFTDQHPLPPALTEALRRRTAGRAQVYLTDGGCTIMMAGAEAGKFRAIDRVRTELGLAWDEVAVFGDDLNDVEMLRACPHAVAMGNAAPEAKAAAAFVTTGNDADGIARGVRWAMSR